MDRLIPAACLILLSHAASVPGGDARPPVPPPAVAASLDVTVAEPSGRPFEGAFVMAFASGTPSRAALGLSPSTVRHAVSGRDGRARLEALPPGPWTVTVHARGFVTRSLWRVTAGPVAVRLEKGGVVTGQVVSSDGGPIPGARVAAASDEPVPPDWPDDATRNVATTDARGFFRLEGVGSSPVTVSARAPGRAVGTRREVRAGERLEIVLYPGSTLRGVVHDDAARPVKGALVRAEADRYWGEEPPPERTDADGRFEIAGVTPGEYTLVAREGGHAPAFGRAVVEPEAEARATLVVSDGGFVTGRLVDERGLALRGRVRLDVVDDLDLAPSLGDLVAADAKSDGTFALGPLPLGELSLAASAPRHATRRVHASVGAPGRTVDVGDVALEKGLAIRGGVRDAEGRPLPGVRLTARSEVPGDRPPAEAETGEDGRFALEGVEAGRYRVSATAPGRATAKTRAEAGGEPLEIVLETAGALVGRLVDAAGRPAAGGSVVAKARDRSGLEPRSFAARADAADGSFRVEGLASGAYDLEARASSLAAARVANAHVSAGRTTDVGTVTLGIGGRVRGSVVDTEGRGIAGASVYAETDPSRLTEDLAAETDPTGAFEIRGVPPGRVLLRALHPAFTAGGLPEVQVQSATEPVPVRIVLGRGGRVEGRLRHRDGRPFTAGRVIVTSSDPSGAYGWPEPLPLDGEGRFVAEHVPSGQAQVHVLAFTPRPTPMMAESVTTLSLVATRPIDVAEGETATADVALRDVVVAGRVTQGGRAAAGIRVSVTFGPSPSISFSGLRGAPSPTESAVPPALAATTREDGTYELLVFRPGLARVGLAALASGQGFPAREVTVPDTDRFPLDVELGEAAVSGTVVDRETGAPLPDVSLRLSGVGAPERPESAGRSGPDGRFALGAEAGDYVLSAEILGRVRVVRPVSVGPAGLADVRIEMERGLAIVGRVLDVAGRGAAGHVVVAIDADGFERAFVRADGSFRLEGLGRGPYALRVGSRLAGYATRPGVLPGPEPLTLPLRPAGKIAVRAVSPDGRPVAGAVVSIPFVDGVPLEPQEWPPTSDEGSTEVAVPAGEVGVAVSAESGAGFGSVTVGPGETASVQIVLRPGPVSP